MHGAFTGIVASSRAVAAGFVPTDIAGLTLWLKADSLSLVDGDPVGTWADQSGNGNDATGSGSARPTYKTAIVNGKPILRFDGSANVLATSNFGLVQPENVFIVVNVPTTTVASIFDGLSSNFMALDVSFPSTGDLLMYATGNTNVHEAYPAGFFVASCLYNGASSTLRINGGSAVTDDAGSGNAGGLTIGMNGGAILPFQGDIAEVLIYDSALGSTDRGDVETYLMSKYGL